MRSADRARRDGIRPPAHELHWTEFNERALREGLMGARIGGLRMTVVVADDVASWRRAEKDAPDFYLENFPSVAPPWEYAWIEYPSHSGRERRIMVLLDQTATYEILSDDVYRMALGYSSGPFSDTLTYAIEDARSKGTPPTEIRWILSAIMCVDDGRSVVGPMGFLTFALNKAGQIAGNHWMFTAGDLVERNLRRLDGCGPDEWLLAVADTGLWTIALANMRNVTTEQITPPTQRRHRKRGNLPPVRYHVLRLKLPGGRRTALDGRQPGPGGETIRQGIHTVRGHLAHYGDCCPGRHEPGGKLFGRLTGVYWIPAHLAGRDTDRQIITDYETEIGGDEMQEKAPNRVDNI